MSGGFAGREDREMLNAAQIYSKLYAAAHDFRKAYYAHEYARAYYIYLRAHTTALMCELDQEQMSRLFGNAAYIPEDETPEDGLFSQEMVRKVGDFHIVHHLTTDELHLHPREPGILHDERDCITRVCTGRHPEGIPIYDALDVRTAKK